MNEPLPVPATEVVIADDALERLAAFAQREHWQRALVVMDPNTGQAIGSRACRALRAAGVAVHEHVFPVRSGLLADPDAVAAVRRRLGDGTWPVAAGSGVLTDIVRRAAHLEDRDFVSVPSAASMDGYASSVAALQIDGVKVSYSARAPRAIFADPSVAAAAPLELTRAGVGDLLAKASARVDWLAAHELLGERYVPEVAERVRAPLIAAIEHVRELLSGGRDAAASLLSGLVQSGIAMAEIGSSRPASGWEHHASHFWDLLAARGLRPHRSHGLQVGYATRFAVRLHRFAFGGGLGVLRPPAAPLDPLGPAARAWLGEPTPAVVEAVAEKRRLVADLPPSWPQAEAAWSVIRRRLAGELELGRAADRALELAGFPASPGYLDVDLPTLRATVHHATRLRARYTVVDLLEGQGRLDDAISALTS